MELLRYLDFELKLGRSGDQFTAQVISSPAGEAKGVFQLPFTTDRLENLVIKLGWVRRSGRSIHSTEMAAAQELGGKLFEAVFAGELRACLRNSLDAASSHDSTGLRIKLRLQDVPELADLPWEYLFDPFLDRFMAQSIQTPIVRYIEMPERITPLITKLPLQVLVMASCPTDYVQLNVERERALLDKALAPLVNQGKVIATWLQDATLGDLQRRLRTETFNVFHFIGHGGFDEKKEEGVLILKDDRGRGWKAGGRRLGTLLHDHRTLRLAVLNSCEGARNSSTDPFSSVAATLIRQGIPAVVAMQFEITDEAAIKFSSEFYAALVDGYPVDAAVTEARKAIYFMPNDVEWGTPVLYLRSPDGKLFHWEKPQPEWEEDQHKAGAKTTLRAMEEERRKAEKEKQRLTQGEEHLGVEAESPPVSFAEFGGVADPNAEGDKYYYGRGVPQNNEEAVKWYRKAAEQGDAGGQANLGVMYEKGRGVPQSDEEAVKWYRKAAEQGHAVGQKNLGFMYDKGRGVPQNDEEAVKWYRKAAEQGDAGGQTNLGFMYREGRGAPQSDDEAVKWYRKAVEQGDAGGQANLGFMYEFGRGVPQNNEEAVKWYHNAAAQGNIYAQKALLRLLGGK